MPDWLTPRSIALVGAGGFAGAIGRHALAPLSGAVPWGTLAANLLAAFVLGIVLTGEHLSSETRLLVGTGLCGALSTYSTFALETTRLAGPVAIAGLAVPGPTAALCYVAGTYGLGVGAAALAAALVRRWYR